MLSIVGRRTLGSVLAHHAERRPDKPFLLFESAAGETTAASYAEFDARAHALARVIRDLGAGPGQTVALHLPNGPDFLLAWFGCARARAVMVPTNPASTAAELAYILEHSGSRVLITTAASVPCAKAALASIAAPPVMVIAGRNDGGSGSVGLDALLTQTSGAPIEPKACPEDPVAILYTSGTTARPKGVVITHGAMLYGAEAMAKSTRLGPDDRHLVALPLFHAAAQMHATLPSLLVGGSIALLERFSASRFFSQAVHQKATRAALFAAPLRMLLAQPPRPEDRAHSLRSVTFAQNLTEAQLEEWEERFGVPLLQLWGMTETVGLPLINPIDGPLQNMTMGLPALGYECRVVDARGHDVAPGSVGELIVRAEPGLNVMREYFKDPAATARTLRDGWLFSGDQVELREDGYIRFVDRSKDLIKRAGENIASGEVEAVLKDHPDVFDAAVVGVPDAVRDECVKAVVVAREGSRLTAEAIRAWCAGRLATFKIPEVVEFRKELPRTSVGKIQKHLLREKPEDDDADR